MSIPLPTFAEAVLFLMLAMLFFLPGSALLILSRSWTRWQGLQRYVMAVGLSISFYPVLFYGVRFVFPQVRITAVFLTVILIISAFITGWGIWKHRVFSLRFERLEWFAIIILMLTFISRFWIALTHPYPAWSDSLHHTLLTELTAVNGRLPETLAPYFPNRLDMYHLGLYSLSGSIQLLTSVPAHTALLWTTQFLNGLAALGVYLALDRYAGRLGAVAGMAIIALFSTHPALWVNWGRFTQLSSLTILLINWVLTLETIQPTIENKSITNQHTWMIFLSALSTAGLFFLHFRVAIFYLPLIGISTLHILYKSNSQQRRDIFKRLLSLAVVSAFTVLPVLWVAGMRYFNARSTQGSPTITPEQAEQLRQNYYSFPLSTIPHLVAPIWLLILTAIATLIGLIRRNALTFTVIGWTCSLIIMGNLYLFNIPMLGFTNLGAILIMLYLPIGLVIGTAVFELHTLIPPNYKKGMEIALLTIILIAAFPATYKQATNIESYRHFITDTDIDAMNWIKDNLPEDATFAINTYFWLPNFAHGTDAGYWIPYFTDRNITTSSMITADAPREYKKQTLSLSEASERLENDLNALETLYNSNVEYIYIGAKGDFSGSGLQYEFLMQSEWIEQIYQNGDTIILHIRPPL